MPTLAHKVRLNSTPEQATYFKQACGTAQFVWNWAVPSGTGNGRRENTRTQRLSRHATLPGRFPFG